MSYSWCFGDMTFLHCHSELVSESQIEHTGLCHPEQQEQSAKRSGVTFYATA